MPKTKPRKSTKYKHISLPEPLINRIRNLIDNHPELGFTSPTDFVKHATIEELKKLVQYRFEDEE